MNSSPDDLTLIVRPALGGQQLAFTGWTSIRVTRGIERCPSDFEIMATERNPLQPTVLQIFPGDQCQVMLGTDLVLTGYIDQVMPSIGPSSHSIRIVGRSKCADLVDCSAMFSTFQLNNTNPVQLAAMLCQPFGISVETIGDIGNTFIPLFAVILTETPMEIIERVSRYAALLTYDDTNGNLILTRAGSTTMQSGFAQGQNIQSAGAAFTMNERHSAISAALLSTEFFFGAGAPADQATALNDDTIASATDPGVLRHRPLLIIAEQNDINFTVTKQRVQWEVNRRYGRSQQVQLVCDSWRDSAGQLWQINSLANVDLPVLKIPNQVWLISEVSFLKDEKGTRAEVTLMPAQAFQVEPIVPVNDPFAAAIVSAINNAAGASTTGSGPTIPITPDTSPGGPASP
jgi:prophage tail gpP-like protein